MKETKIPAVYKEELQNLLISIGEAEPIENGQRNCSICSRVISLENVQLIIPRAGNLYEYICNDPECVSSFNNQSKK